LKITKYAVDGDIILLGDINARTGDQETDFMPNECISDHVPLFENYAPDINIPLGIAWIKLCHRGAKFLMICACRQDSGY
jgi:hypothetical protein